MDLSGLDSSLPLGTAERDLGDRFRVAATSITNLYKSSLATSKHAYQAGYKASLNDVLGIVQSCIVAEHDATLCLSRLMDWAEARETAMAAFASEEGEEIIPPQERLATLTRQALAAHLNSTQLSSSPNNHVHRPDPPIHTSNPQRTPTP
ncbi:hypothetical protein TREMEDRAFT_71919, partial [Tremella mesenterica DSM 1558]|uniref:uncharacterized protein n=1 Tax=Tremella mesenterica (strain ATCC 24925 / CBS 8224 / DSM 1558 / NBRC 9311 / NRRL Y-6157 / RJB 2259-6 / UBC 559-6) TaxID=578456 RepID=UPI0003F4A14B